MRTTRLTRLIVSPPATGKSTYIRKANNPAFLDLDQVPGFNELWHHKKETGDREPMKAFVHDLLSKDEHSVIFTSEQELDVRETVLVLTTLDNYLERCIRRYTSFIATGEGWVVNDPRRCYLGYADWARGNNIPYTFSFSTAIARPWPA